VGDPVSVYVVVTLEYMVGEVLELADSTAKAQEQDGITAILRIYHDMMQSCFWVFFFLYPPHQRPSYGILKCSS